MNIESAKIDGLPIANLQDGKGYFIPATKEEARAQLKQTSSRAKALLVQQKALVALIRKFEDEEMYGKGLNLDEGEVG